MATTAATAAPAEVSITQSEINNGVNGIFIATNAERAKLGLKPFILSANISKVSQAWSEELAATNSLYHNHNYPTQMPPGAIWHGENAAVGPFLTHSERFVTNWMNSPGHRAAILTNHTHIGIGFAQAANGQVYAIQNFGNYATVAPTLPTPLSISETVTSSSNEIRVDWSPKWDTVISSYSVVLYQGSQLIETQKTSHINTLATFKNLKPNTSYTVKVTAHALTPDNGTLNSPVRSLTLTTKTPVPPMTVQNPPAGFKLISLGDDYGLVEWAAPKVVSGYIHSYTTTLKQSGKADQVFTQNPDSTGQMFRGLTKGTSYTVEVKAHAVSHDGATVATSPVGKFAFKTTGGAVTPPLVSTNLVSVKAPTGLKNAVGYNYITSSWTAPKGTVGKITSYTATLKLGTKVVKTTTITANTYKFTGLASNTGYIVEVRANAVSANGAKKASSPVASVKATTGKSPLVKVSAPAITTSKLSHDRVTLSWKKPAVTGSITSYRVLVKHGTKVVKTYNLKTSTLSQSITGLKEKTKYSLVVEALATSQDGKKTAKAISTKAVTMATSPASAVKVSAPASFAVSSGTSSVKASWKRPAVTGKIASYTVILKQGTKIVKSYTSASVSRNFTGLKRKSSYKVEVKANAVSANGKYKSSSPAVGKTILTK